MSCDVCCTSKLVGAGNAWLACSDMMLCYEVCDACYLYDVVNNTSFLLLAEADVSFTAAALL